MLTLGRDACRVIYLNLLEAAWRAGPALGRARSLTVAGRAEKTVVTPSISSGFLASADDKLSVPAESTSL